MSPQPEFFAPRQATGDQLTPRESWWHVPVTFRRPLFIGRAEIPRCTITARVFSWDVGGEPLAERSMRWQSKDNRNGVSEKTLESGRIEYIPIAFRDEDNEKALLTDQHALVDRVGQTILSPGTYRIEVEIQSGAKKWVNEEISKRKFILRVPPNGVSNGHFLLEERTV